MQCPHSGRLSPLPQELVESTIDCLWDEPVQLFRCALVCHAWYHAAIRYLGGRVTIRSRKALCDLVHTVMSKPLVNRRYSRVVQHLSVTDNIAEPFVHTFPTRLPGCFFTSLTSLEFCCLDWTQGRLHTYFFSYLRHFSAVTSLTLTQCRLRSSRDIHRIVNTFPNLAVISVDSIVIAHKANAVLTVQHPQLTLPAQRSMLTGICTWTYADNPNPFDPEGCEVLQEDVLSTLSSYSSVAELSFFLSQFISFKRLRHFLEAFPNLHGLDVEGEPEWEDLNDQFKASPGRPANMLEFQAWKELSFSFMSAEVMHRLLEHCTTRSRRVHGLCMLMSDLPCPALLQIVEEIVQESGPELEEFRWEVNDDVLAQGSELNAAEVGQSLTQKPLGARMHI